MLKYIRFMGILQLLNIVLFWVFFGFLAAYIAKKKGRSPRFWFFIGLGLGVLGVLLILIFPKKVVFHPKAPVILKPLRSDAWIKMWYYLDPSHQQQGPLEFPDLIQNWKQKKVSEKTLVWGEGMPNWIRLAELPDLVKEMEQN